MKLEQEIEKLFFIILGTFITSAYSRDFTLLELLRKPLKFPINKNGNYFLAKIPKGLPWQETVIIMGDEFATKTKDIPVPKGIQKADEKNDFFVFDAGEFNRLLHRGKSNEILEGYLTYYPLYRFVTEPFRFHSEEDVLGYIVNTIAYVFRREGFASSTVKKTPEEYAVVVKGQGCPIEQVSVFGDMKLDKLELKGKDAVSLLNLVDKNITVSEVHSPVCFEALYKTDENALRNISLTKTQERIELGYDS